MRRSPSCWSALALAFAVFAGSIGPAFAQSSDTTGIIQITVHGSDGSTALADARVFLIGPTVASALTNKSGIVKYTDVPSGLYRVRVGKGGYQGVTSSQFEVLGQKEVDVNVDLATFKPATAQTANGTSTSTGSSTDTSGLKIIGSVRAKVTVTTTDVDQDSAVRRISDSLLDALGTVGGVDVTQSSNDPDAPQTISLRGHDESQTAITLDGIPLGAPGAAVNLRSVNTDLFTGAGVSFGAQAGALGGSVNFRTLQPTQTWQSQFASSYGTFDRYNYQIGETGSIGKLGIAALFTKRAGNNPLTFQDYEDESGLTYAHGGESANIGDYLKLRYGLTDRTTLMFTALQNNQAISSLCTSFVTPLPCGIGPDNGSTGKFQFMYGTVQSLIGDTAVTLTSYVNNNVSLSDDLARFQLECPGSTPLMPIYGCAPASETPLNDPFSTRTQTLARGVAGSATLTRDKHTITLSGSTYASITSFTPLVGGSQFVVPANNAVASRQVQLSDSFKVNDRLAIGPNVSYAGTTGAGESLLGGFSANWRPQSADTYNASIALGSSQPAAGLIRTYGDPNSARVNCLAGTAQVSGPGDQPSKQSAASYDLSWTHQWAHGQFSLDTYRQTQSNQLINASLTAGSLGITDPSNPFYGYYAAVGGYFSDVCPTAGAPNVYVSEAIGGTTRLYQGFTAQANIGLGKNVVLIPSYTTSGASILAADPRFLGFDSTLILNSQLPGRPVHTGNLTLDAYYPPAQLELLANAHYVGSNNNQYISPYVLFNVGISHPLGIGRVTVFAANLLNTESGMFSTEQYAVPVPLSGGGELLQAARPNAPRSYTVTYSFNTGARPGAGFARPSRSAQAAAAAQQAGQQQRAGLGFVQLKFVEPPPGTDPLSVATVRPECTATLQPAAQKVLAQLKAAADAYAAGQALPEVDGITVTPHGDPKGTWWFGLGPKIPEGVLRGRQQQNGQNGGGPREPRGGRGPGGGPGGPPTGFQPEVNVAPNPNESPRPQFSPSPELLAALEPLRALSSCAYGTVMTPNEAKAKGYDVAAAAQAVAPSPAPAPGASAVPEASPSPAPSGSPRPAGGRRGGFPSILNYAPGVGIFVVRAPQLGTGGGSVKQ
ncbi:MAG TPA: TonB-dependent receptor [Candidatus Elarobacter sp.]|nr:TonB-dependent receptor [Candidatus Elarobacter sp.]